MSDAAGTWEIRITSPLGSMDGRLVLEVDGKRVTGVGRSGAGAISLREGTVDGDTVTIPIELSTPIAVRASAKLAITGDSLSGKISGAPIPGVRVRGHRVTDGT